MKKKNYNTHYKIHNDLRLVEEVNTDYDSPPCYLYSKGSDPIVVPQSGHVANPSEFILIICKYN